MKIYKFEMKRAFRTSGFYISILIGSVIAIVDWVQYGLYYSLRQGDWLNANHAMSYPVNFYESWIGGANQKYGTLFFLILPLLVVIPYAVSFQQDNKNHYIVSICTRVQKKSYLRAKFCAVFISGGITALIPLLLNLLLNAAVLPGVYPQVALGGTILPKSSFSGVFYTHPLLYVILSLIIIFTFSGVLAVSALYVSFYSGKAYSVLLFPFVLCMVIMAAADLVEAYGWQPFNFLNPAFGDPRFLPFLVETLALLLIAAWEFLHRGNRQDILN